MSLSTRQLLVQMRAAHGSDAFACTRRKWLDHMDEIMKVAVEHKDRRNQTIRTSWTEGLLGGSLTKRHITAASGTDREDAAAPTETQDLAETLAEHAKL